MLRKALLMRVLGGTPASASQVVTPPRWAAVMRRHFTEVKRPSVNSRKPKRGPIDSTLSVAATLKSKITPDATVNSPNPTPIVVGKVSNGIRRSRRSVIFTVTLLSVLGLGAGVWYSRANDMFHGLFTRYVPFGKKAALYLEELDSRGSFPNRTGVALAKVPTGSDSPQSLADAGKPEGRRPSAVGKEKADTKGDVAELGQVKHGEAKPPSSESHTLTPLKVETKESVAELSWVKDEETKAQGVHSPVSIPSKVEEETDAPAKVNPQRAYSAKPQEPIRAT